MLEGLADVFDLGSGELVEDGAVLQEDEVGPEFDAEGAAEGLARAVLDLDMADAGSGLEQFGKLGGEGLAVRAPGGAEFEQEGAFRLVDLVTGGDRLGMLWRVRHGLGSMNE